jgi:hypothetical protein
VVVVVAEHGVDGDVERPHRVGEDDGLLGFSLCRQVARQEDDVDLCRHCREGVGDALAERLGAVDVACRSNADLLGHPPACSRGAAFTNGAGGYSREPWPTRPPRTSRS